MHANTHIHTQTHHLAKVTNFPVDTHMYTKYHCQQGWWTTVLIHPYPRGKISESDFSEDLIKSQHSAHLGVYLELKMMTPPPPTHTHTSTRSDERQ